MVNFNGFDKGVLGKPLPADSTLNNMKKQQLILLSQMKNGKFLNTAHMTTLKMQSQA
ncbi:hypothetical protein [Clostridium sp. OF09-36]|uniref:hypothetical protein n=1 Tax=Clostridium sp. OF09-36 TaxID=2292310 RepID=UPI0015FC76E4|nr:hypothetical protein [Clostridium sp. OF09-36]